MPLECVHHLLVLHFEIPFEDEHVTDDSGNYKVVHWVVQQYVCDAVGVLSRLDIVQVCIIFFFFLRVITIIDRFENTGLDTGTEVFENDR